jgi:CSLREA domain-containing protein
MRRIAAALALTALTGLAATATAGAAVVALDGAPLNVLADGLGAMQVRYDGQANGTFSAPTSDTPRAGLEILQGSNYYALSPRNGRTLLSGPTLGGDGSGARTLTSAYRVGPDLEVTETLTYTDGDRRLTARYAIRNVSAVPVSFHAGELSDLFNAGPDAGAGVFAGGPPRAVGGLSTMGVATRYVESTPWTSYQSGGVVDLFAAFGSGGLRSTVDANVQDNGIGAEWDVANLAAGATRVLEVGIDVGEPAPTVVVTTTADKDDQVCNADCSLREAFNSTSAGAVVVVPAGRYLLGSALTLFHTVTIRGAGAGRTIIDGNGKGRAIEIQNAGVLDLSGVTVTGGRPAATSTGSGNGGGILVSVGDGTPGVLTLRDSVVSGNVGVLSGGGIANQGSTTILDSTISGNTVTSAAAAGIGGGVAVQQGTLRVLASTISDNTTSGAGAGVATGTSAIVTLQSATIAGNVSSGAGLAGGIALGSLAAVTATGSIVAGNGPVNCSFGRSATLTSGYDLSDDATCRFTGTGDQQNSDPQLGALGDNGGPTPTRLPAAGSPAIDHGSPGGCLAADQRGTGRPQGNRCDVGAVERVPPPPAAAGPGDTATADLAPAAGIPEPVIGAASEVLPRPVVGRSSNLHRAQGTVLVQLPGTKQFVPLTADRQVPVGTVIDATKGRVTLSVSDGHGGISTAVFYGGIFRFTQTTGSKPLATMTLVGARPTCARAGAAAAGAARTSKKKKKVTSRQLWGDGKGNFQTKGTYSSATVRGTKWNVKDTCAGTTTRVARGVVAVRDFVKQKTVLVKAGRSYLARPRGRR